MEDAVFFFTQMNLDWFRGQLECLKSMTYKKIIQFSLNKQYFCHGRNAVNLNTSGKFQKRVTELITALKDNYVGSFA